MIRTDKVPLVCPGHRVPLSWDAPGEQYFCTHGCHFPVLNEIPRFVTDGGYCASFGCQWNEFCRTQLDSHTGARISRDRLQRLLGGSLEVLTGKDILEAGCGAGRFTEIMLEVGARVFSVDMSNAVEANYSNCKRYSNYFVCQSDILGLPFPKDNFDIVICIGVIQHTPDPEKTISALCSYVRPEGLLVIDHYSEDYHLTPLQKMLRTYLIRKPAVFSMRFCKTFVAALWPFHRMLWILRSVPLVKRVRSKFLTYSPVIDYQEAYKQLSPKLLYQWAVLDTHDTLTDVYKHLRSAEEIARCLKECGMEDIKTVYAGNGVEARARKSAGRRSL